MSACLIETLNQQMNSFKLFYINLDARTDRKLLIEHEFERMGLAQYAERWPAIRNETHGHIGCYQSHLSLLRHIRNEGLLDAYEHVVILEDDFEFLVTPDQWTSLFAKMKSVPYYMVNLAYNVLKSAPYNETFRRALDLQTTAGYVVSKEALQDLIQLLEAHERLALKRPDDPHLVIDQLWKKLQGPSRNWFYTVMRIGRQRESYSDIEKRLVNYNL